MPEGRIRQLITDRRYGFIRTEQREDLFFHFSELQGIDHRSLREGQEVRFEVEEGPDGSCAVKVRCAANDGESVATSEDKSPAGHHERGVFR